MFSGDEPHGWTLDAPLVASLARVRSNQPMNKNTLLIAAVLLAVGISPLAVRAAKSPEVPTSESLAAGRDPAHLNLVEARRKVNELPEVLSAQQQSKIDRSLVTKAAADYKQARTRASASEASYRKLFDENLQKLDPEAAATQLKERQAFRDRMEKARANKPTSSNRKVAQHDEEDDEEEPESSQG